MILTQPVESLASTSPVTVRKLKLLDIHTYWDLINYVPFRYENLSLTSSVAALQEGETVTVKGTIIKMKNEYTRRGMTLQKAILSDGTGEVEAVWFNQTFIPRMLPEGCSAAIAGTVKRSTKLAIEPISYERLPHLEAPTLHTGRLVPVYTEKAGLSSRTLREKIHQVFRSVLADGGVEHARELFEWLPPDILNKYRLDAEFDAYYHIHFPVNTGGHVSARKRLEFDELLTIQLSNELVKREWKKETVGNRFLTGQDVTQQVEEFITKLPFQLTGAQRRVIDEILADLSKPHPMNRFVQGDVGSGKTVVAAVAAYLAHLSGYQTLIMAPTEILAVQHHATISRLFAGSGIDVGLQTGAKKTKKKGDDDITSPIVVGTHALISKGINYAKVGLVIIDEQHRFGVAQRAMLKGKGMNPHLLTMTATPIPRTIALTLHGELDLSVIDEMPKGRLPIKTFLTPTHKRASAYQWMKDAMRKDGIQIFVICPLIEESETETLKSVKAATKEYEHLKDTVFPDFKVGMLHGKMKPKEKEAVMQEFKEKKYDILVATSVVEVGIDVPNATIIVIEGSQRYGMAQLHQLRGRVGRGDKQSYCLLFSDDGDYAAMQRLKFFASTNNGMILAEYDLKRRGAGDIYGVKQHGYDDLKFADLTDLDTISKTKGAVEILVGAYTPEAYPKVKERLEKYRYDQISRD